MTEAREKRTIPLWAAIVIIIFVIFLIVAALILRYKMTHQEEPDPQINETEEQTEPVSEEQPSAPADAARTAAFLLPDAA